MNGKHAQKLGFWKWQLGNIKLVKTATIYTLPKGANKDVVQMRRGDASAKGTAKEAGLGKTGTELSPLPSPCRYGVILEAGGVARLHWRARWRLCFIIPALQGAPSEPTPALIAN